MVVKTERGVERRVAILDYIADYTYRQGYPPTVRDITTSVGLASTSATYHHLMRMKEDGLIWSEPGRNRTWSVFPPGQRNGKK